MLKKTIKGLSGNPGIFNILRRIIEANYISIKKVIRKEFCLDMQNKENFDREKILDIPCGTGEFCMLFDSDSYTGLDISKKYIDYARKKYKRSFFCRDAKYNGFDDNYFDKILMLGFLHHLDNSSVVSVLKEVKRVLKHNGALLLIEDAPTSTACNITGKILQRFDVGSNIRPYEEYKIVLEKDFIIKRYYHLKSGFWDYSVFILFPKST